MKIATIIAAAAFSLCAGAAIAQSIEQKTTILCLDISGRSLPPTCVVPPSRLDTREDMCTCPMGGERVTTPVCPKGVQPPPDSAAYERARLAAINRGSLVGAMYQGKPMCVAARNPFDGG